MSNLRFPKWYLHYGILAMLCIGGIFASTMLNREIVDHYLSSLHDIMPLVELRDGFSRLSMLAYESNTPGNNIFISKNPDEETRNYRQYKEAFLKQFQETLAYSQTVAGSELLAHQLTLIDTHFAAMDVEAQSTIQSYRESQLAEATESMARMDAEVRKLNQAAHHALEIISDMSRKQMGEKSLKLNQIQQQEYAVLALMAVLLLAVLGYGVVALRNFRREVLRQSEQAKTMALSEARLGAILNTAFDAIITIGTNGLIESANQTACKMFGYDASELLGKNVSMLMSGEHARKHDNYIAKYLQTGDKSIIGKRRELVALHNNGTLFPIELSVSEIRVGEKHFFTGFVRDLTSLHKTQQELLQNQEHLSLFIKHTPAAIAVFDQEMRYLMASDRWMEDYQLSRDVIGQSHYDVFPDIPDEWKVIHRECLRGQIITREEDAFERSDGSTMWVKWAIHPWRKSDHSIGGIVMFTEVITSRKEAELSIKKQQRFLDLALRASQDGVWELNLQTDQLWLSPRWKAMLGYEEDELPSNLESWKRVMVGDGFHQIMQMINDYNSGRIRECVSIQPFQHKDGGIRHILIRAIHEKNEHGEVVRMVGANSDITEQESAKHQAEMATRLKSEFLANMSHEIRTPMNGVIGMVNLLQRTELTDKQQFYANTIQNSADALLQVVNDILDFSKIEAGKLELEIIPFDMHDLLEEITSLMAVKAQEKRVDLLLKTPPGMARSLMGDPGRIRQILFNLISNAIKFTDSGHVMVRVESKATSSGRMFYQVEVEDSGIGIPEDKLEYIFNKFTQADGSTTRKFGGTGLGLAICRQLCHMMGGDIGVRSQFGKGSTFWFTMSLEANGDVSLPVLSAASLKGKRLLVVDDHATARELAADTLSHDGAEVMTASNAHEAMNVIRRDISAQRKLDAVLIDFMMPGTDGFGLAKQIHKLAPKEALPLMLITSAPHMDSSQKLQKSGIRAYLPKPYAPQDLSALTAAMLANPIGEHVLTRHQLRQQRAKTPDNHKKDTAKAFEGRKILLVEDNLVNQQVARIMLENLGCSVTIANDGLEAIKAIKAGVFHLVFMDCQMPVMDGFEATELIRKDEKRRRLTAVPIVALTANAMKGDEEKCLAAGMNDYITKPMKMDDLERVMSRWSRPPHMASGGEAASAKTTPKL